MQIPIFRGGGCVKKVKLGDLCEIQSGGTPSRSKPEFWVEGNIPWVKIKDINSKYVDKVEEHITELGLQCSSAKLFSRETILYTIFATIGEVAILDIDAATNQAIAGLYLKSEKVLKDYLYYFLISIKNRVKNDSRGVAQNNINLTYLKNIEVPIVEIAYQQEICDNLSTINQIIAQRNKQLIELSNLVKSRFNEMFGDDSNFEKVLLSSVCDVRDGTHDSPKYVKKGFPLITSKNVTNGVIDFNNTNYISQLDFEKINQRSKVDYGDILLPMIGTIGNPVVVDTRKMFAIKNVALIKFYNESTVHNIYIKNLLTSFCFDKQVLQNIRGGTQKFIALRDIRGFQIPLPPLSLQNEFADFVAKVDKSQFACQIAIKLWRNSLKSSII